MAKLVTQSGTRYTPGGIPRGSEQGPSTGLGRAAQRHKTAQATRGPRRTAGPHRQPARAHTYTRAAQDPHRAQAARPRPHVRTRSSTPQAGDEHMFIGPQGGSKLRQPPPQTRDPGRRYLTPGAERISRARAHSRCGADFASSGSLQVWSGFCERQPSPTVECCLGSATVKGRGPTGTPSCWLTPDAG